MGIGGKVYSTISVASAESNKLSKAYAILSGTSMAAPYVAGYVEFISKRCVALLCQREEWPVKSLLFIEKIKYER
jgi:hypothetical protein